MKNKNPVKLSCNKIKGKVRGFNIIFLENGLFKATYSYIGSGGESSIPLLPGVGVTIISKRDNKANTSDDNYCDDSVYPFED